jgi:flagellum-specific peptidoglycan hydrolase FlgJ
MIVQCNLDKKIATKLIEQECPVDSVEVRPYFFVASPKESLKDALDYYELSNVDIVYAQAVLETDNFNSRICKEYNNLFGLYDSKHKQFYRFDHWTESVVAYKNFIQIKKDSTEDYYSFLSRIGYAEDPKYIQKLKRIVTFNK